MTFRWKTSSRHPTERTMRMRVSKLFVTCFVWMACCEVAGFSQSQTAAKGPARGATRGGTQPRVMANLLQLMRGTLFPESNVIFAAQNEDPAKVLPAKDPST